MRMRGEIGRGEDEDLQEEREDWWRRRRRRRRGVSAPGDGGGEVEPQPGVEGGEGGQGGGHLQTNYE